MVRHREPWIITVHHDITNSLKSAFTYKIVLHVVRIYASTQRMLLSIIVQHPADFYSCLCCQTFYIAVYMYSLLLVNWLLFPFPSPSIGW